MFPAEQPGEFEPYRVQRLAGAQDANGDTAMTNGEELEEDYHTDEGAIWPIQQGRIVDWPCFFALLDYVWKQIGPPFHTPVLLIAQPIWTSREHEKITQFIFEQFKTPGFALVDSAVATCYAHGLDSACIVDVGKDKADVTAIRDFLPHAIGRTLALSECGGDALTQKLHQLLAPKGFSLEMCEQLKKSPICELLPYGIPLPGTQPENGMNPAAAASTGANDPTQRGQGIQLPRVPGLDENGDDKQEDDEGVLDVASIVAGGKMNEYLAKKEREKQEKLAAKKKDVNAQAKPVRLKNSDREKNTFFYEDYALLSAIKTNEASIDGVGVAEASAAFDEGEAENGDKSAVPRRELTVGVERFQAGDGQFMTVLTDAIFRTIQATPRAEARANIWNNLVIVGNGAGVRGFKEAVLTTLHARFLISPSSATMFTSELPSNLSTPAATGANTPLGHLHAGSGVNPLLHAATTAAAQQYQQLQQMQHVQHPSAIAHAQAFGPGTHASRSQTPSSIKLAKLPEYFSEWKEHGSEEATFLGAQVAARVLFVVNSGVGADKGFMSRTEYNENGPGGISDYAM